MAGARAAKLAVLSLGLHINLNYPLYNPKDYQAYIPPQRAGPMEQVTDINQIKPLPANGTLFAIVANTSTNATALLGNLTGYNVTAYNLTAFSANLTHTVPRNESAHHGHMGLDARTIKEFAVPFAIVALVGLALFCYYLLRTFRDVYTRERMNALVAALRRTLYKERAVGAVYEEDGEGAEVDEKAVQSVAEVSASDDELERGGRWWRRMY
ncbi:uncharacterized protein V1510DRAFT_413748 [Dipodascopsis tothii]|uniref:uncharacterized protein n=1 Tax=Dipodascopsis tothii TaxID=44089 RepID=UPI0034CF661E